MWLAKFLLLKSSVWSIVTVWKIELFLFKSTIQFHYVTRTILGSFACPFLKKAFFFLNDWEDSNFFCSKEHFSKNKMTQWESHPSQMKISVEINGSLCFSPFCLSLDEYRGRQRRIVNNNLTDIKGPDRGAGEAHRGPKTKSTAAMSKPALLCEEPPLPPFSRATAAGLLSECSIHAGVFIVPSAIHSKKKKKLSLLQTISSHLGLTLASTMKHFIQEGQTERLNFLIVKNPTV